MSGLRRLVLAAVLASLAVPLVPSSPAAAAPTELFFTEYIEGSSNNKALEIYNGTGAAVDLTAGGYNVQTFSNGSTSPSSTINLSGSIQSGDVFVLAHSSATAAVLAQADQLTSVGWFNGDDAVVLRRGTTVVDAFGQIGFDPGTEWGTGLVSTADNTLRRKATIEAGDPEPGDAFDPSVEWDGFANDTFSGLGCLVDPCPDLAPRVVSSIPADDASGVPVGSNVTITFSEAVNASASAFALSCTASGDHTFTVSTAATAVTLDPDSDFAMSETCTVTVVADQVTDVDTNDPPDTMTADHVFDFATERPPISIHDIQQATHVSSLAGAGVTTTGIVTATNGNSFYMQEPVPDADDATSEGILVFRSSGNSLPAVQVGDAVRVSGTVSEFRPGGDGGTANLTTTEFANPIVVVESSGNPVPAPTVIGAGGRVPPGQVIDDDSTDSVETGGVFDPANDGIDFYESLEGMLVQVNDPVAVGPTNNFGEIFVVGDGGANASPRTPRGGVLVQPGDFNPERIALDDTILLARGSATPDVNVGDSFEAPAVGVLDYSFGNFKLFLTEDLVRVDNGLEREVAIAPGPGELAVATFNVENLAATDPQAKFDALAVQIVGHLLAPDIIAIEEIQDNNGTTNDAVVAADQTLARLVAAIAAAGGPQYDWRQIDPVDDQDGGAPGGNIRVGFLFRTDRGVAFVDRPGGDATTATGVVGGAGGPQLTLSPGRIDPTNAAWSTSRKPLAGEFMYRGETVFVIVNHFNSKGGDEPLFGHSQPPERVTELQRHQQAAVVNDFVDSILAVDGGANVIVLGDINDFDFSETVAILEGGVLHNLMDTLPANERYSYVFEGNSQVLDQILVSDGLAVADPFFDPVHINAEFFDQQSDHDPSVTIVDFDKVWRYSGPRDLSATGLNAAVAGQMVPVGFSLGGDFGLAVLDGDPTSVRIDCATRAPSGSEQVARYLGPRPLSYDRRSEVYTFRWKTEPAWRGTCRLFTFHLDDGTLEQIAFRFAR